MSEWTGLGCNHYLTIADDPRCQPAYEAYVKEQSAVSIEPCRLAVTY